MTVIKMLHSGTENMVNISHWRTTGYHELQLWIRKYHRHKVLSDRSLEAPDGQPRKDSAAQRLQHTHLWKHHNLCSRWWFKVAGAKTVDKFVTEQ